MTMLLDFEAVGRKATHILSKITPVRRNQITWARKFGLYI